jgi:hypothetical protein
MRYDAVEFGKPSPTLRRNVDEILLRCTSSRWRLPFMSLSDNAVCDKYGQAGETSGDREWIFSALYGFHRETLLGSQLNKFWL